MKIFNKWLFTFMGVALLVNSNAQQRYDLQSLINRMLSSNYQVMILRNDQQIAENNNTLGNAGFLPIVTAQGTRTEGYANTVQKLYTGVVKEKNDAKTVNLNGYVGLTWTVFDGFRMFAMREQLGLIEQMGAENLRYYLEQTVADIATSYYQIMKEQLLLENLNKALDVSRFRYMLEKKKSDIGTGNALMVNQALVDFNADSIAVLAQISKIKSIEIEINTIVNNAPEASLAIADNDFPKFVLTDVQQLKQLAIEKSATLKKAHIDELISETNRRIQQASLYPTVGFTGQYSYTRQTSEAGIYESNKNFGPQFGINIRFNLFDGGNTRREIKNSVIELKNSALSTKQTQHILEASVFDYYLQLQSLQQQLQIAEQNGAIAEKSLDIAKVQFQQGVLDGYSLRLTQLSVLGAKNQVTILKYAIETLSIQVDRLTGMFAGKYL